MNRFLVEAWDVIMEDQQYTSAKTSISQMSAGIRHAVTKNLIQPGHSCVDVGGGRFDLAKNFVESNVHGTKFHVYDPYNRTPEHNRDVENSASRRADYVGCHNVLNVIKEPEARRQVLEKMKSFMGDKSTGHITVYEGNRSGEGKETMKGQSWQNNMKTADYFDEVKSAFPDHKVTRSGPHIMVTK